MNENAINFQTIIKMVLMLDPNLSKVMEGNYELFVKCKTTEEHIITISRIFKRYLLNDNVSVDDKFSIFMYARSFDFTPEVKAMMEHLDDRSKQLIDTILGGRDHVKQVFKELTGIENLDDDEHVKKLFYENIDKKVT